MDANRKKIIVIGGAAIAALVLILFVVLFFLGGEPEPKPVAIKPPGAPAEAGKPAEEAPKEAKAGDTAKKAAPSGSYAVKKGATLEDIAAKPEVFGDAAKWWALWQANSDAVSYAFQHDGKWVAIARAGKTLKVPEGKNVSEAEKSALTSKVAPHAVQFGSYPSAAEADGLKGKLAAANPGMDFYVIQRTLDGVTYHRVRAGLFKSWNEAEKFGASVAGSGKAEDYYTTVPLGEEIQAQTSAIYKKYKGGE